MSTARAALVAVMAICMMGCTGAQRSHGPERATPSGQSSASASALKTPGPAYSLEATIDPDRGRVQGKVVVTLPRGDRRTTVPFRVFPNLPELETGFTITGGDARNSDLEGTILRLKRGAKRSIALEFAYTLPELEQESLFDVLFGGDTLVAGAGLLGRHRNGISLGHWFPTYLPAGVSSSPKLGGFGDLGNYPASDFRATLRVPSGWKLVSSGVTVSRSVDGGTATYREVGGRLRDLGVYLGKDLHVSERTAGGVAIRTWAHADHVDRLDAVSETAAAALELFGDSFGAYPWPELDVVDAQLGAGVGGMEWPAMVWIGADAFAGDIPGLGAVAETFGRDRVRLLDEINDDGLLSRLGLAEVFAGLETTAEFVIVHEIAHQWWFAVVGSDSLASPVLDEPLAQYSACLYWRQRKPDLADAACAASVTGQYRTARLIGVPDSPADRPTDRFDSALQYGAVVYGKAPGFFFELEQLLGRKTVLAGLRSYARQNAWTIASEGDLLRALEGAAPARRNDVRRLWTRWMEGSHGDEDLGASGSLLDALFSNS